MTHPSDPPVVAIVEPSTSLELANSSLQKREGSVLDVAGCRRVEARESLQEVSRVPGLTFPSNEPVRLAELKPVVGRSVVYICGYHPEHVAITICDVPIDRRSRAKAGAVFVVNPDRWSSELYKPVAVVPGEVNIVRHLGRIESVESLTEIRDSLNEVRRCASIASSRSYSPIADGSRWAGSSLP